MTKDNPEDITAAIHSAEVPLYKVFRVVTDEQFERVVVEALAGGADGGTPGSQSLCAVIDQCQEIAIKGFSRSSKAPPELLKTQVADECLCPPGNDRLLGAVLRAWREAQEPLRAEVEEYLAQRGLETGQIDFKNGALSGLWEKDDWELHCKALAAPAPDADADPEDTLADHSLDTRLMLSLVANAVPALAGEIAGLDIESRILREHLEDFAHCGEMSKVWEEIDVFVDTLRELAREQIARRNSLAADFGRKAAELLTATFKEYQAELDYLEFGQGALLASFEEEPRLESAMWLSLGVWIKDLTELMESYQQLRPQAASLKEERSRVVERQRCEDGIIELGERWREELESVRESLAEQQHDEPPASDAAEPIPVETDGSEDLAAAQEKLREAKSRHDKLKADYDSQRDELRKLRRHYPRLEKENGKLTEQVKELGERLAQAESMLDPADADGARERRAEYQISYSAEQLDSTRDAIDQAGKTYAGELLFALNSKSQENSDFQKPDEVFKALAWLATDYRDSMLHPVTGANLDEELRKMLRKACSGWTYTPRQSQTAVGKYPDWYVTKVGGKRYDLQPHIGRGNRRDPRNTIRIGFTWDGQLAKVVVGYIGRHPKTDAS